jgi:hypothetical protein
MGEITREETPNFRNMGYDVDWYGELGLGLKLKHFVPQANIGFGNSRTGTNIRSSLNALIPLTNKK